MLIIKPNKIKTFKNMQQYDYFIKWQMVGLISDIINRFTLRCLLLISSTCFPWGFSEKGRKKYCTVQVSLDEYWSYFCNFRCGINDIIWWHFPQSRQNIKYCPEFNSGEVSRLAKKTKTASQNSTRRDISFTFSARWICMRLIIIMRSL